MIEDLEDEKRISHYQMESAMLLVEAVEKASDLGFTLDCNGSYISVHKWTGTVLVNEGLAGEEFGSEYITSIIDWLDGVGYGRGQVGVKNSNNIPDTL